MDKFTVTINIFIRIIIKSTFIRGHKDMNIQSLFFDFVGKSQVSFLFNLKLNLSRFIQIIIILYE